MKDAIICVHGMLCVGDRRCVEKRLRKHPGIHHVEANFLNCTATVHYDEKLISLPDIKKLVGECGYHCTGESVPDHVCKPVDPPTESTAPVTRLREDETMGEEHGGHAALKKPTATSEHIHPEEEAPAGDEEHGEMEAMAHEMGHGPSMDMETMVKDIRHRFFLALLLTIPVFLYSPLFY